MLKWNRIVILFLLNIGISSLWASDIPKATDEQTNITNLPLSLPISYLRCPSEQPDVPNYKISYATPSLPLTIQVLPTHQAISQKFTINQRFWGLREDQIDQLFENSFDMVCVSNNKNFSRVNNNWTQVLGWSKEELLTTQWIELIHPDDTVKSIEAFNDLKNNTALVGLENRYRCKDGTYRHLYWITLPETSSIPSEDLFSIARDITDYKLQEIEVNKLTQEVWKKNTLLIALDKISATYYKLEDTSEPTPKLVYYRPKDFEALKLIYHTFIELTQSQACFLNEISYEGDTYTIGEIQGCEHCPQYLTQELGVLLREFVEEAIKKKQPLFKNHFLPPYACLVLPLPIDRQKLSGVIVLLNNQERDFSQSIVEWIQPLTERFAQILNDIGLNRFKRQMEAEIRAFKEAEIVTERQNRKKAEEASRLKSAFVGHMSHEIRTPLNAILGFLELARSQSFSEEGKIYLGSANDAAKLLLSIANDILDVSRMEANMLKIKKEKFNLSEVTHKVIELLTFEAKKKKLDIQVSIDSDIPKILLGDDNRFQQILVNLINNALKFTQEGKITIDLKSIPHPQNPHIIILLGEVSDTGIGIASNIIPLLFKPFSQGDNSTMRQFDGTGLGLHIIKQLCQKMNGDIEVSSELGIGSRFQFTIELGIPPLDLEPAFIKEDDLSLRPLNILVAEDNLLNQVVISAFLKKMGHCFDIVNNGEECVQKALENTYDVVLMDGEMPLMNGLEATHRLRATPETKNLPIIGVSAHAMEGQADLFIKAGMNGYLAKQIHLDVLAAEIYRCLHKKNS